MGLSAPADQKSVSEHAGNMTLGSPCIISYWSTRSMLTALSAFTPPPTVVG